MIIAVDGPTAAGKGTLAKRLAAHYGLALLDTGKLYRAVGLKTLQAGAAPDDAAAAIRAARALTAADLDLPGLRTEPVSRAASVVAAIAEVRAALVDFQRQYAHNPPDGAQGAVLDGRDIGTVICPDADVKIFLTASAEARAERRWRQLQSSGATTIKARVLADLQERDQRDSARSLAPLKAAPDAFLLDTTAMDADQAFAAAVAHIELKRTGRRP
jgi:cytidylate kinase